MVHPKTLAANLAAELAYSTDFMTHYVEGVTAKLILRPMLYDTASGELTDAGARFVRHQVLTRHADRVLRPYEADWIATKATGV